MDDDTTPLPTFAGRLQARFAYKGEGVKGEKKEKDEDDEKGTLAVQAVVSKSKRRKEEDDEDEDEDENNDDDNNDDTTDATPPSPSSSKKRRCRTPARYAPPQTYAHLPGLPDALGPDLLVLFVGLNPGLLTARSGHAYAHPSNRFWHLLHVSGITPGPDPVPAAQDHTLPARFRLGLTNIVARPSRNGAELRPAELDAGVATLEAKARHWRPRAVCLVGKAIWESVVRVRYGRGAGKGPAFRYGWQDACENFGLRGDEDNPDAAADDWKGARLFVATSTSGLAAYPPMAEKKAIWRQLGEWVQQQRELEA